jgi:hypothetical protein
MAEINLFKSREQIEKKKSHTVSRPLENVSIKATKSYRASQDIAHFHGLKARL